MSDYYDLADILAEEEKVPVVMKVGVTGLGRALDPSCDDDDLKSGSQIDMPCWMAPVFVSRGYVSALEPKIYGPRLRKELQADAGCVNLRVCSPYFFSFGVKVSKLVSDKSLAPFLFNTFVDRYSEILSKSLSITDQVFSKQKRLLSKEEAELLEQGHGSMNRYQRWLQRLDTKISAASVLGRSSSKRRAPLGEIDSNAPRARSRIN